MNAIMIVRKIKPLGLSQLDDDFALL